MPRRLIGADEAGYGPNLGPLVITATHWTLPETFSSDEECDLWSLLAPAVSQTLPRDGRLHVADSKQVYQPGRGLAVLERPVLALLGLLGEIPRTSSDLRGQLTAWRDPAAEEFEAPWYRDEEIPLPVAATWEAVEEGRDRLQQTLHSAGVALTEVRSDVVSEPRFNRLTDAAGSKGAVLTRATLALVGSLWGTGDEAALVVCDKHGGRNGYAAALAEACDEAFIQTRCESRSQSAYAVGTSEFRFETGAERHLPVAVASMVSKYVREVSMDAFNAWWSRHRPGLRPTKGYPQDAARFRRDIAEIQGPLGVFDDLLWRRR